MHKGFQKTANDTVELALPHPGILNRKDFDAHFELHCYQPAPDLRPFVTHIWTQRRKAMAAVPQVAPLELSSGPHVYLFFTSQSAFIHGAGNNTFAYSPFDSAVVAGVKFNPGGFYPFLQRSVASLNAASLPVSTVFTGADEDFTKRLLMQSDAEIVRSITELLRSVQPKASVHLTLIKDITAMLTADDTPRTVQTVAKAFDMSERSLQLLFQTHVGVGVKWIITRQRLLAAIKHAQTYSHMTWAEIAAELGYSSQSHLSRDFRRITGLSPSEYLQAVQ